MSLPTTYQQFIALSRYARYDYLHNRRETWDETVDRLMNFWMERYPAQVSPVKELLRSYIYDLKTMPSMRTLMTAGEALKRDEASGYNCCYVPIDSYGKTVTIKDEKLKEAGIGDTLHFRLKSPIVFDCIMYILLCGTGVGFSVERQFINQLPSLNNKLSREMYSHDKFPGVPEYELSTMDVHANTIRVADSKYGWASALRILIVELYNSNYSIKWDLSNVRPSGAPLKTFGGRSSGPDPLHDLFSYTVEMFRNAKGIKLTSLECHDLVCKIASVIVVGGVRRSALISLSNLSDDRMRMAKYGQWYITNVERGYANNSVAYTEKPNIEIFIQEWLALIESKSGERGIFNREASRKLCERIGRNPDFDWGTNPCSEIILRPSEFCNLSEVVIRPEDTYESIKAKVEVAVILGTLQATLTNFIYLPEDFKENCDEERLLGVSMTGFDDHEILSSVNDTAREWLIRLREHARRINKEWAEKLGINAAAAITCVKPSGTVSQLVDCASGIHPRYSQYYIRRVRADVKDPLAIVMKNQGFPCEIDVTNSSNYVFSFPIKAPPHAVLRNDKTAIEQLDRWLMVQRYWCDHKPSITVYVRDEEWLKVGAWVYDHFDEISGIAFLPHTNFIYKQAPYEEIDEETYLKLLSQVPETIDMNMLMQTEKQDMTLGAQELACSGGMCEI